MKFANLEIVKLLVPRLGFGSPEVYPQARDEVSDLNALPPLPEPPAAREPAEPIAQEDLDAVSDTQLSLLRLADELECALQSAPTRGPTKTSSSLREIATLLAAKEPEPIPDHKVPEPARPARQLKALEGCKVAAIGFGRQDIAGLATSMNERRARIEFLPRGEMSQFSEFDLLLLNAASTETLKREAGYFREILALGIPTVVIGSRAALTVLRDSTDPFTWDFAAKPLHLDELAWRAAGLLTRQLTANSSRRLPARVVVADHDPFTRTLIESAMNQLGVQCTLTEEGEAAWTSIEELKPGAVILDLTLPNRDGFQLMADIRRTTTGRKPKIIVLSARQSETDILRAFSLGADDYITKPFSPLELSARLTRLLGGLPDHA